MIDDAVMMLNFGLRSSRNLLTFILRQTHRAVYRNSGRYMAVDAYDPVRQALIAAIPPVVSQAHRDKLKSTINYGYEKAQSKRIEELLNNLPQPIRDFVTKAPKPFVRKLVDTRNRYTHYDPHDTKVIFEDDEMAICNHGLRLLLLFLFLSYLKVPGPTIFRGVQRLQSWRIYSQLRNW